MAKRRLNEAATVWEVLKPPQPGFRAPAAAVELQSPPVSHGKSMQKEATPQIKIKIKSNRIKNQKPTHNPPTQFT
jgi:hypothetical protein